MGEGIRSRQLNLPELYEEFDNRYGRPGVILDITVSNTWTKSKSGNYYVQEIDNLEDVTPDSKLIIQVKKSLESSYEENLEKENLFAHIDKVVCGEGKIAIYSCKDLDVPFDIQVLCFIN